MRLNTRWITGWLAFVALVCVPSSGVAWKPRKVGPSKRVFRIKLPTSFRLGMPCLNKTFVEKQAELWVSRKVQALCRRRFPKSHFGVPRFRVVRFRELPTSGGGILSRGRGSCEIKLSFASTATCAYDELKGRDIAHGTAYGRTLPKIPSHKTSYCRQRRIVRLVRRAAIRRARARIKRFCHQKGYTRLLYIKTLRSQKTRNLSRKRGHYICGTDFVIEFACRKPWRLLSLPGR